MGFRFDGSDLMRGLMTAETKSDAAIRMYAENGALELEKYAKENRPWTDRSGAARQRLKGYTGASAVGWRLYLAHGVGYGIWLELAHEKRFSIIPKTIEYVGKFTIIPGFKRLLERLGR